jgi:spore maturation protein CgeB
VQKYNEYQMFIVPEETAGLPSVNAIEGMACGTAYIGLNHSMYKDIGLIPNKDYISYDGTIKDLIERIKYYKLNQTKLKNIAQRGCAKVRKLHTEEKILSTFKHDMDRYIITNNLVSSFILK